MKQIFFRSAECLGYDNCPRWEFTRQPFVLRPSSEWAARWSLRLGGWEIRTPASFERKKCGNHFSRLPSKNFLTRVAGKEKLDESLKVSMQFRLRARLSGYPYPSLKCEERLLAFRAGAWRRTWSGREHDKLTASTAERKEIFWGNHTNKICIIEKAPLRIIGVIAHVDAERKKSARKSTQRRKHKKSVLAMRKTVARIIDYGEFRFLSYHFEGARGAFLGMRKWVTAQWRRCGERRKGNLHRRSCLLIHFRALPPRVH